MVREAPLTLLWVDAFSDDDSRSILLHRYTPVKTTVVADAGDVDFSTLYNHIPNLQGLRATAVPWKIPAPASRTPSAANDV